MFCGTPIGDYFSPEAAKRLARAGFASIESVLSMFVFQKENMPGIAALAGMKEEDMAKILGKIPYTVKPALS